MSSRRAKRIHSPRQTFDPTPTLYSYGGAITDQTSLLTFNGRPYDPATGLHYDSPYESAYQHPWLSEANAAPWPFRNAQGRWGGTASSAWIAMHTASTGFERTLASSYFVASYAAPTALAIGGGYLLYAGAVAAAPAVRMAAIGLHNVVLTSPVWMSSTAAQAIGSGLFVATYTYVSLYTIRDALPNGLPLWVYPTDWEHKFVYETGLGVWAGYDIALRQMQLQALEDWVWDDISRGFDDAFNRPTARSIYIMGVGSSRYSTFPSVEDLDAHPDMASQELKDSCVPACVREFLARQGVTMSEEDVIKLIRSDPITGLTDVPLNYPANQLNAKINTTKYTAIHPDINKFDEAYAVMKNVRGPWIATVKPMGDKVSHAIIVESIDDTGMMLISDPRGQVGGGMADRYRVSWDTFFQGWFRGHYHGIFPLE